jgi:hypothetical protein
MRDKLLQPVEYSWEFYLAVAFYFFVYAIGSRSGQYAPGKRRSGDCLNAQSAFHVVFGLSDAVPRATRRRAGARPWRC